MKLAGWILIVVGIAMAVIRGFSVPVEKNIVDAGPIQINKTEHKWIGWPNLCRWHYRYCWCGDGSFIKKKNVNEFFSTPYFINFISL